MALCTRPRPHLRLAAALMLASVARFSAAQDAPEKIMPQVARGTYVYALTLDASGQISSSDAGAGASMVPAKAHAEISYVLAHAPDENTCLGTSVFSLAESRCDIAGYAGALTALLGPTACKASAKTPGIFVLGSPTAELTGLDPIARQLWTSYRLIYPLPQALVGVGETWGGSQSEAVGDGRATADVRSRLDRLETVEQVPCAIFAGNFEMRARLRSPDAPGVEVEVAYTGKWEAAYDPAAKVVRRQTGDTDMVLGTTPAEGESKRSVSSLSTHFEAVLKPDAKLPELPANLSEPESVFATAWKILASPTGVSRALCQRARDMLTKASDAAPDVSRYQELRALIPTPGPNGLEGDLLTLKKAAGLEPNEPRLALEVGLFQLALRDPAGAIASLRRAADLDPQNAVPLYLLAHAQQAKDDPEAAAKSIADGNARPSFAFYLPPLPQGMSLDAGSMRGVLRIGSVETILRRLRELAVAQLEYARSVSDGKEDRRAVEVAEAVRQMGERLLRATPQTARAAAIGAQIDQAAIVRLEISYRTRNDDEAVAAAEAETKRLSALEDGLKSFAAAEPLAQAMRVMLVTPLIVSAAGPPLPLAAPVYLDEQAAVAAAVDAAFAAEPKPPEAPAAG